MKPRRKHVHRGRWNRLGRNDLKMLRRKNAREWPVEMLKYTPVGPRAEPREGEAVMLVYGLDLDGRKIVEEVVYRVPTMPDEYAVECIGDDLHSVSVNGRVSA